MRNTKRSALLIATLTLIVFLSVSAGSAQVMSGGNYKITSAVQASGGGTSTGSNKTIEGTAGQTAAGGPSSKSPLAHDAGFWPTALASAAATPTPTPTPSATPNVSINDVSQAEGNGGISNFTFTVTLSAASGQTVTVAYATVPGGTATWGNDYQPASGTVTFVPGEISKSVNVLVNGDPDSEPDETFFVSLSNPANATIAKAQAVGTIINDDNVTSPTLQLSAASYSVGEGAGGIEITVIRSGDTSGTATVKYATSDTAGLQACTVFNGRASERCDYVTSVGTVRFAAGETTKVFSIPLIDDVWQDGTETFTVTLNTPVGAALGAISFATITITDNDLILPTSNPIDGVNFFVRQQYLDFLGRQPDQGGFQNWVDTLAPCPNGGFGEPPTSNCDRLHVAAGFFQSDEFLNRGYFAFRFYMVSFNQRPTYAQFIPDMADVGGPKTPAEEEASKIAFADAFVVRPEFLAKYPGLSGQALANALLQTAGLPGGSFDATGKANGQILRGIAETSGAFNKFLTEGTVSIQYFAFQRRDPDTIGYQNNLDTLNANPNNLRHMIFIFIYSDEYRSRFGPQ